LFLLENVKDEICKAEGEPTEKHNGRSNIDGMPFFEIKM
jgi:hypothetical protein